MLAIASLNNQTDVVIYTAPAGKTVFAFVDIYAVSSTNITLKINNTVFLSQPLSAGVSLSIKLILNGGDSITASSTGQANFFVHGIVQ
ncbi:hypothetical protein Hydth_0552 [Hydrogenobacter thermophilus TK-6]|uniref:Uncharacterized protein n=1 Tax=Hydrogenobacter thermophilus (strain DSM 6534 / IAM 12695 / TK-6) TaxID=608538 RepID=D3DGR4_HYDTT|nr:hypothetical protein [Hydrogenobacter thermophilus]ADO44952.1 hypothetical protein Hydth_0552 [Hydrogenobacter thermophilus TK-6]BAI69016.1 hypothetical protein HTH_0554 [Hydrogenobacter thermophilus TK-6]